MCPIGGNFGGNLISTQTEVAMSVFDEPAPASWTPMGHLEALRTVRDAALRDWSRMREEECHEEMADHLSRAIDVMHRLIEEAK